MRRRRVATTRRGLLALLAGSVGAYGIAHAEPLTSVRLFKFYQVAEPVADVVEQVIPKAGIPTGVAFEDSIQKLVAAGIIDPDKFRQAAGDLPAWVENALQARSEAPLVFNAATAPYLIDLLWPIGLANKVAFNKDSPIATPDMPTLASTGGWTFGDKRNGSAYFNRVGAVYLTAAQQAMVLQTAKTIYRPCCDNSAFFQDCNHGSAMLGLLELAASQGETLAGLYRLALAANSYWFPDKYVRTALYFSYFYRRSWHEIEPKHILSATFSSAGGWYRNVNYPLVHANIALPGQSTGLTGC